MKKLIVLFVLLFTGSFFFEGKESNAAGQKEGYHLHDLGVAKILLSPGLNEMVKSVDVYSMGADSSGEDPALNTDWIRAECAGGREITIFVWKRDERRAGAVNILSRKKYENDYTSGKIKIKKAVWLVSASLDDNAVGPKYRRAFGNFLEVFMKELENDVPENCLNYIRTGVENRLGFLGRKYTMSKGDYRPAKNDELLNSLYSEVNGAARYCTCLAGMDRAALSKIDQAVFEAARSSLRKAFE